MPPILPLSKKDHRPQKAVGRSSRMPRDVLNDMLFTQLQFLEKVLFEIPVDKLKTAYAVMVQERIVELNQILFKKPFHP